MFAYISTSIFEHALHTYIDHDPGYTKWMKVARNCIETVTLEWFLPGGEIITPGTRTGRKSHETVLKRNFWMVFCAGDTKQSLGPDYDPRHTKRTKSNETVLERQFWRCSCAGGKKLSPGPDHDLRCTKWTKVV